MHLWAILCYLIVGRRFKVQYSAPSNEQPLWHFSHSIKARRARLDLTQEALAQIAGVSLRSLKAMEKGTGNPTLSQLTRVISVLGWDLELKERGE
jgi:DNA-binding XRE family transcriptional regulator